MKKISLLIAFALFAGSAVTAKAQDDKQAQFERDWYATCFVQKDEGKCLTMCKDMLDKSLSSNAQYLESCKKKITNQNLKNLSDKFQVALKNYYDASDSAKLEQLFSAGEEFLKAQPGQQYVVGQLALAGANAVLGQSYKNMDKVKEYADQSLGMFQSENPPEGWKPEEWSPLRELVMAQMNQFLGYRLVETKGNPEEAISYLTKSISVKSKSGAGWKDPNNYWLRANLYSKQYDDLRAKYGALTDEEKTGEKGKEYLTQVNQLLDTKLIPEYARVVATATKPEAKPLYDAAKQLFDSFWNYRTGAPDKAAAFLKAFEADPTIAGPAVPAKTEASTDLNAPASPSAGSNVKLSAGAPTMAPGGKGSTTTATTPAKTTKPAPAKGRRHN